MYWIALLLAGLCEIGWPLGLKLSDLPNMKAWGLLLAIVSMALSGLLLWYSLKEIPIGTAYAVWTSIGAVHASRYLTNMFPDKVCLALP
ncbi:MAG: hypothetical protein EBU48_05720 [Burkholderiaceae bacterium]|nr:hypothetical protein [Burkholderiaceae bacterium]